MELPTTTGIFLMAEETAPMCDSTCDLRFKDASATVEAAMS